MAKFEKQVFNQKKKKSFFFFGMTFFMHMLSISILLMQSMENLQ